MRLLDLCHLFDHRINSVAAVAEYEDERAAMKAAGADVVFNFYAEAGAGFAEHTLSNLLDILPEKPAAVDA